MRCSTCGEHLRSHETACPTCGAAVARSVVRPTLAVRSCPRCGYMGEGIEYFKRPGHVCLLVGVSLFTYGIGGLAYWLARRKHRICAQCGLGWEKARIEASAPPAALPGAAATGMVPTSGFYGSDEPLPRRGMGRRVIGVGMALVAALLISVGFVQFELAAVAVGSVMGAGATGTFWWGFKAMQDRRRALMQRLQRRVLLLATDKGGMLTVTEVAASMNLSLPAAEKVLDTMDDGFRVRSDITDDGIIIYEFPEVLLRGRLESGNSSDQARLTDPLLG